MQPLFRKTRRFRYLWLALVFIAVMAFDDWLQSVETRSDRPRREAAVRFTPLRFDPAGFAPLRLVGAWKVEVDDPRFGGVSALAIDGAKLIALTDSGTVIDMPKPGARGHAFVRDLPAGPGTPGFKVNRDSEALAAAAGGRGWWVAFEHWHQLWLYDSAFARPVARIDLGKDRWPANRGLEAIVVDAERICCFRKPASNGWRR